MEVSSDDEGYKGAWFVATIVNIEKDKFLVEYRDMLTDDGTQQLKEEVDVRFSRPCPPEVPVVSFQQFQEVDAWYNDAWLTSCRSDEEGYQGSWFTATVVDFLQNGKYFVEYLTLKTDDLTEQLKEEAYASDIRPYPPDTIMFIDLCCVNRLMLGIMMDGG